MIWNFMCLDIINNEEATILNNILYSLIEWVIIFFMI